MVDTEQMRVREHENRIRSGYMWALFCAILWGLWYIPGTVIWTIEPFTGMFTEVSEMISGDGPLVIVAALVTAFNALTVIIALMVWNGTLLRLPELGRTLREFKPCSKWFLIGSICGGPIAIFGSFMAMAFIGGAFAAVAGLLYPVVGAITANLWYGEKITKRAAVGILVIIAGGVTIFGGGLIQDLQSVEGVAWLGYLGGAMAAIGWGLEGAIAGVGLEVSESDTGLTARFVFELLLWWIIIIPALAIAGFPMFEYAIQVFQPIPLLVMVFAGITFGFCYVSWYKSFPLIGVGRGQAVANLYGLMSVIFLFLFLGSTPAWTVFVGGILCIAGAFIMFTEESLEIETLRG
jgi:drug/metabolite transporter (DMT)-like permease